MNSDRWRIDYASFVVWLCFQSPCLRFQMCRRTFTLSSVYTTSRLQKDSRMRGWQFGPTGPRANAMMMKIESKYNDEDGGAKYCDEYDYGHDEDKCNMMMNVWLLRWTRQWLRWTLWWYPCDIHECFDHDGDHFIIAVSDILLAYLLSYYDWLFCLHIYLYYYWLYCFAYLYKSFTFLFISLNVSRYLQTLPGIHQLN